MSERHALIIDDNDRNMDVITGLLDRQNITSTKVLDPSQLQTTLQDVVEIDVVFVDLEMPVADGFQVFDQLRGDSRFDGIPIIAYTVHVSELPTAYRYGFDGFLGKPLDSERFPEQLERIFNGQGVWESA